MKGNWKKKWIRALRSGKYKQCNNVLSNGVGFCCLGVLRDLRDPNDLTTARGEDLLSTDHERIFGIDKDDQDALADANDNGASFKQIADWIEKCL